MRRPGSVSTGESPVDPPPAAWVPLYADALRSWLAGGGALRLPVSGVSMRPTIEPGARIVVGAWDTAAVRSGDIVLYEDAHRLVCHRVLTRRRRPDGWQMLTAGDGVRLPATWIPASALIGRVVAIEAGGRSRRLDDRAGRVRALVAVTCSWAGQIRRRLVRSLRRPVAPVHAA